MTDWQSPAVIVLETCASYQLFVRVRPLIPAFRKQSHTSNCSISWLACTCEQISNFTEVPTTKPRFDLLSWRTRWEFVLHLDFELPVYLRERALRPSFLVCPVNNLGVTFESLIRDLVLLALLGSTVVPFDHHHHAVRHVRYEL